jgi:hypothetical protein
VLARVYTTAGRVDDAIDVLQRIIAEPTAPAYGATAHRFRIDPAFAPLRANPRFQRLMAGP